MCRRGEVLERSFAPYYGTKNLRQLHLRGRENIAERVLVHAAGSNIGLTSRTADGDILALVAKRHCF